MSKKEIIKPAANGDHIDASSKIEVIKNLIFGENIQAYNSEFETLKKEILDKRELLEELIENTRKELTTAIDNIGTDVNIRISDLENAIDDKVETLESNKVDKKILGKLLIELGEKINTK